VGVYIVSIPLYNVEDTTILLIITLIGIFSLIGARIFKPGQAKTKQKKAIESAKDVLDHIQLDQIERLKGQLKSEAGRANRLQALKDQANAIDEPQEEISSPGGKKPATWEEITALVNTQAPKYAKILPLFKNQVMEATEGMSLEEILNYVKQFRGDQQSQAGITPESLTYRPDWA